MAGNSIGKLYRLSSFGESHGIAIGGIIDGCPPGLTLDIEQIQKELNRRRPGQSKITSQREESDTVEILSGIFDGKTTGTPIGFVIYNKDHKSDDYDNLREVFRPSHADYTYYKKYGLRDHRGGGRASARETISRVVAGAIAKQVLGKLNIQIQAYVSGIGKVKLHTHYKELNISEKESNIVRCPDPEIAKEMILEVEKAKDKGDSLGGIINCVAYNVPPGLGDPVYDKLHANLGKAMLSINAVKGFEIGSGFSGSEQYGSEHNDIFDVKDGEIFTHTNNSGGIQGGISNGEDIIFRLAFKPTATIYKEQQTVDLEKNKILVKPDGRHDPCIVPRAVPIVEAMAAMVILDAYLINKSLEI